MNNQQCRESGSFLKRLAEDIKSKPSIYIMLIPVVTYFAIFCYYPMYGAIIAFKDYNPMLGILGSNWAGLQHFKSFFNDIYFWRLIRNTLRISISDLLINFPLAIVFALLLNEVRAKHFKKFVQSVSYIPHFISMVVVCGMIKQFTGDDGVITWFLSLFGLEKQALLAVPRFYLPIHILSNTWQHMGWNSIIYLAALSAVDDQLYEAAALDGATRLQQVRHVTLPGIMETIVIMFILKVGQLLNVGYEKVILLYNPNIYETADIINSYVYRKGLQEFSWSYSTAVGLFNTVVSVVLVFAANRLSKKVGQEGLF